jgi:hypothetical protein
MAKFDEGPLTSGLFVFGRRVKAEPAVSPAALSSASRFCSVDTAPQRAELKPVTHFLAQRNFFSIYSVLTEPRGARFSLAEDVIAFLPSGRLTPD